MWRDETLGLLWFVWLLYDHLWFLSRNICLTEKYMILPVLSYFNSSLKLLLCIVPSSTEVQPIRQKIIEYNELQPQWGVRKTPSAWHFLSSPPSVSPGHLKGVNGFIFTQLNFFVLPRSQGRSCALDHPPWLKFHGSVQLYFTYFILFIHFM